MDGKPVPYDVAVIGAGINGAGIARDAALRGLSVVVVDQSDLCSGTSAIASRLIHGGLRYLEYGEIPLVFESLRERITLRRVAPHLVKPLRICIPIFAKAKRGPLLVRLGMLAYDLLSAGKTVPNHEMLTRDEIIEAEDLPIRYAAYSPCFRREAGAAGAKTRGILRVHQFDKVEMVAFVRPEESNDALEWMTQRAEILLQRLGLPYRVKLMATGDMGFTQAKKYDLEAWIPGADQYKEIVSCSNCTDYQANRLSIRYGQPGHPNQPIVHTLNSTAVATSRALVAIMEQYQLEDGRVAVPDVLKPYMGGQEVLEPCGWG